MLGEVASIIPGGSVYNAHYETPVDTVEHQVYNIERKQKAPLVVQLLKDIESSIIFVKDARSVNWLARFLKDKRIKVDTIHDEMSAHERVKAVEAFRKGRTEVLLSAGSNERGIDVSHLTHVIHYDLPESLDSCVHRVGRVGRAGRAGTSIFLVSPWDSWNSSLMFRLLNLKPIDMTASVSLKPVKVDKEADTLDSIVLGVQEKLCYEFKNISLLTTALKRNYYFHDPSESMPMLGLVGRMAFKLALADLASMQEIKSEFQDYKQAINSFTGRERIRTAAQFLTLKGFLTKRDLERSNESIEEYTFYNCIGAIFLDSNSINTIKPLVSSISNQLGIPSSWNYTDKELPAYKVTSIITPELKERLENILDHNFEKESWLDAVISGDLRSNGSPIIPSEIIYRGYAAIDLVFNNLLRKGFFHLRLHEIFEKQRDYKNFGNFWNTDIGAKISREISPLYEDFQDEKFKMVIIALAGALYSDAGYEKTEAFVRQLIPESKKWLENSESKKRGSIDIPKLEKLLKSEGERLGERRRARLANEQAQASKAEAKRAKNKSKKQKVTWEGPDHKADLATEVTIMGLPNPKYKNLRKDGLVTSTITINGTNFAKVSHEHQIFAEQLAAKAALEKLKG